MIVPEFWAEGRIQKRFPDRQITVRRFGWSDVSQQDAQRHADERVQEAFNRIASGERLPRREQKVRYNGAEGLPIREQIVERLGDSVVTRNSYGARCLNTPDVFFADIDFPESLVDGCAAFLICLVPSIVLAGLVQAKLHSVIAGLVAFALLCVVLGWFVGVLHRMSVRLQGGSDRAVRRRINAFVESNSHWHLRIYRTPNGFRVMALHATFDPRSEEVDRAFKALRVDRAYAVMCQKQNCFRARLTAKPWRIGIQGHLTPRPGVWPISEVRLPARNAWIDEYENSAANYAACHFVAAVGAVHVVSPAADAVCRYHDRVCRADEELELA
ncbi:MAG: hypothetical protein R3C19_00985 [Planctomycetaceae bacterium]